MAQNKIRTFDFKGGEDYATADLNMPEGMARVAFNYEQDYRGGYSRLAGYRKLVHPDDAPMPGIGPILGMTILDKDVVFFREKESGGVGTGLIGVYVVMNPTKYLPDGSRDPSSFTSIMEITNILDSTGAPTTLTYAYYENKFEFAIHNFKATVPVIPSLIFPPYIEEGYGHPGALTVYGVDGINPPFELSYNPATFQYQLKQIDTTYTKAPRHIEANGNRLAVGFRSGEVAISALGTPTDFSSAAGAGSIGVTDYLTGMQGQADGTLVIYTLSQVYMFYGMEGPLANAELKKHNKDIGAKPYTSAVLGEHHLGWGQYGLSDLQVSDRFGNVISGSVTNLVKKAYDFKRPLQASVLGYKSQYRLYFDNESTFPTVGPYPTLIVTLMNDDVLSITHAEYPFLTSATATGVVNFGQTAQDLDIHMVGTDKGELYQMDIGTSFDGSAYTSQLTLPFLHMGSPGYEKKFKKIEINLESSEAHDIAVIAEFGYGRSADSKDAVAAANASLWDSSFWSKFIWDSASVGVLTHYINGHGQNVSLTIITAGDDKPVHTLKDIQFVYQMKRIQH